MEFSVVKNKLKYIYRVIGQAKLTSWTIDIFRQSAVNLTYLVFAYSSKYTSNTPISSILNCVFMRALKTNIPLSKT